MTIYICKGCEYGPCELKRDELVLMPGLPAARPYICPMFNQSIKGVTTYRVAEFKVPPIDQDGGQPVEEPLDNSLPPCSDCVREESTCGNERKTCTKQVPL